MLVLVPAMLIGLGAAASARDIALLCRIDGSPYLGFNIRVDLENSAVTVDETARSSRYVATITAERIEYSGGMFTTRIDRVSGNWEAWSYTGTMSARGSCQQTDDQRRLDQNIGCCLKLKE